MPGNVQPIAVEWFIDGNNSNAYYVGNTINQPVVQAYAGGPEFVMWCVKVYDVSGCFDCFGIGGPPRPKPEIAALITPVCGGGTGAIDITVTHGTPPFSFLWSTGATTEDITDVPAGTYNLTVTTAYGCDEPFTLEIPAEGLNLSAEVTPHTSCTAPSGAVSLSVNNPGSFTYLWSNGSTSPELAGLAPGSYAVTVTGVGNNCVDTATYTVPEAVVPIGGLSASAQEAFCSLPTGSLDLEVAGGVGPFNYAWSNGVTSQDLANVPPGSYSVTTTAANGCTAVATAEVPNGPDVPSLAAAVQPSTTCAPPNGSIALTASPAAPIGGQDYAFAWSNGATTPDLINIPGGTYTVTATLGSCTVTASFDVPQQALAPALLTTPMSAHCGGADGSVVLQVGGGTEPYSFGWSNGSAGQHLGGVPAGDYAVTVIDAVGCTATASTTVEDLGSAFSLSAATVANTSCGQPNGAVQLTPVPPGSYTFLWSNGATAEDLTGLAAGTYAVTVSQVGGGCTATGSYAVADDVPEPDTTLLTGTTCDENMAGISVQNLTGQDGCDSVVISTISLLPGDTVHVSGTTCDENMAGTFVQNLTASNGCDSVVISTISLLPGDTVHVSGTTCDENMAGMFVQNLTGQNGCDSVVISNISLLPGDTMHVSGTTCDENMAGVFTDIFTGQNGCDSVVISNITLLLGDTTYLSGTTCEVSEAGIFTQNLTGANGCDSVVISTITLSASDTTYLSGTNCNPDQTGIFTQILTNEHGCDSLIISTVTYAQADTTAIVDTTCDATAAGVFTQTFTNQNGCDSVVIETISLAPGDTTPIFGTNCDASQTGVFQQILSNQYGCDSVVITTIYFSPADTVAIFETTCDAATAGVFTNIFTNQNGCDSIVVENISLAPSDTVYIFDTSCDAANTGIFQQIFTNQYGCDSVVILNVSFAESDTTLLAATTCDPAAAGTFWQNLTSADGCDSVVQTTVAWVPGDSVFLFSTTCEPAAAGIFTQNLSNQNGCDSVVTTTVSLLPGDETSLFSTTCDPVQAGVSTQLLTNQNGCDSTVTTTVTLLPDSETFLTSTTCDPAQAGVFTQILTGQNGCDSTVTTTVALLSGSETFLTSTTCDPAQAGVFTTVLSNQAGCDSTVTTTVGLLASDTTFLASATCDAAQAGVFTTVLANQNGCDSVVVEEVTWTPPPVLALDVSDFNGFEVSCPGGADGSIAASATGAAPFGFAWSDGAATPQIAGLSEGTYSITVTDANGCTASASATLVAPPPMQISFAVNGPDCFEENSGAVFVQAAGGAGLLRFSLDGANFQASNAFENLGAGAYQITAMDANGCEATELVFINAPVPVDVELGEDLTIELGEGAELQALVNVPLDSLAGMVWTGLDSSAECPACPEQPVFPLVTTSYSVTVVSSNGCRDEDAVTVFVDRRKGVYVPNAFSPNGDGVNDLFRIFAKPGTVKNIRSFLVFDRWGESVWQSFNFHPDDPLAGWDGTHRGRPLGPAVFVWFAEVEFLDGQVAVFEGEVVLVR